MIQRTSREMDALRYLGMFRFLSRVQIEEFVLGESTLTPGSREVITWRILRRLRQRQLVTTNALLAGDPEGMPTRIGYFLSAPGRRVFEALEPGLPRRRFPVRGTFLLAHALMVAEIALAFLRQARAHRDRDLLTWECDRQVAEDLGRQPVAPDARLVYETAEGRVHAFVEADRGSERSRFFARKIERYLDLYRAGSWRARLPVWPLILTVTRTERRASEPAPSERSHFSGRAEASRISRAFRFTSLDALRASAGPFGEMASHRLADRSPLEGTGTRHGRSELRNRLTDTELMTSECRLRAPLVTTPPYRHVAFAGEGAGVGRDADAPAQPFPTPTPTPSPSPSPTSSRSATATRRATAVAKARSRPCPRCAHRAPPSGQRRGRRSS